MLVRRHGHRWQRVHDAWTGRSIDVAGLQCRYADLRHAAASSAEGSSPGSSCDDLLGGDNASDDAPSARAQTRRGAPTVRTEAYVAARYRPVQPGELPLLPLPAGLRTEWHRRSWAEAVRRRLRRGEATEPPLPSHAWLIASLQLHVCRPPHGLLFCDLPRAERRWEARLRARGHGGTRASLIDRMRGTILSVAERDDIGLVHYPDEKLPCLLACGFHRCWIGGAEAGGGWYVDAALAAAWLGLGAETPRKGTARVVVESALMRRRRRRRWRALALRTWRRWTTVPLGSDSVWEQWGARLAEDGAPAGSGAYLVDCGSGRARAGTRRAAQSRYAYKVDTGARSDSHSDAWTVERVLDVRKRPGSKGKAIDAYIRWASPDPAKPWKDSWEPVNAAHMPGRKGKRLRDEAWQMWTARHARPRWGSPVPILSREQRADRRRRLRHARIAEDVDSDEEYAARWESLEAGAGARRPARKARVTTALK